MSEEKGFQSKKYVRANGCPGKKGQIKCMSGQKYVKAKRISGQSHKSHFSPLTLG